MISEKEDDTECCWETQISYDVGNSEQLIKFLVDYRYYRPTYLQGIDQGSAAYRRVGLVSVDSIGQRT